MIKATYPKKYVIGSFIIDNRKLITNESALYGIYAQIDKETAPWEGEPDIVLGNRLLSVLGGGYITLKDYQQSNPEIVY